MSIHPYTPQLISPYLNDPPNLLVQLSGLQLLQHINSQIQYTDPILLREYWANNGRAKWDQVISAQNSTQEKAINNNNNNTKNKKTPTNNKNSNTNNHNKILLLTELVNYISSHQSEIQFNYLGPQTIIEANQQSDEQSAIYGQNIANVSKLVKDQQVHYNSLLDGSKTIKLASFIHIVNQLLFKSQYVVVGYIAASDKTIKGERTPQQGDIDIQQSPSITPFEQSLGAAFHIFSNRNDNQQLPNQQLLDVLSEWIRQMGTQLRIYYARTITRFNKLKSIEDQFRKNIISQRQAISNIQDGQGVIENDNQTTVNSHTNNQSNHTQNNIQQIKFTNNKVRQPNSNSNDFIKEQIPQNQLTISQQAQQSQLKSNKLQAQLQIIFQQACRRHYPSLPSLTFEQIQNECKKLNLYKFMDICQSIGVKSLVAREELIERFKRGACNRLIMGAKEWKDVMEKLSSEVEGIRECIEKYDFRAQKRGLAKAEDKKRLNFVPAKNRTSTLEAHSNENNMDSVNESRLQESPNSRNGHRGTIQASQPSSMPIISRQIIRKPSVLSHKVEQEDPIASPPSPSRPYKFHLRPINGLDVESLKARLEDQKLLKEMKSAILKEKIKAKNTKNRRASIEHHNSANLSIYSKLESKVLNSKPKVLEKQSKDNLTLRQLVGADDDQEDLLWQQYNQKQFNTKNQNIPKKPIGSPFDSIEMATYQREQRNSTLQASPSLLPRLKKGLNKSTHVK